MTERLQYVTYCPIVIILVTAVCMLGIFFHYHLTSFIDKFTFIDVHLIE